MLLGLVTVAMSCESHFVCVKSHIVTCLFSKPLFLCLPPNDSYFVEIFVKLTYDLDLQQF